MRKLILFLLLLPLVGYSQEAYRVVGYREESGRTDSGRFYNLRIDGQLHLPNASYNINDTGNYKLLALNLATGNTVWTNWYGGSGGGGDGVSSITFGLGMTGGTITTSGTGAVDTSYMMTKGSAQTVSGAKNYTAVSTWNFNTNAAAYNTSTNTNTGTSTSMGYSLNAGTQTSFIYQASQNFGTASLQSALIFQVSGSSGNIVMYTTSGAVYKLLPSGEGMYGYTTDPGKGSLLSVNGGVYGNTFLTTGGYIQAGASTTSEPNLILTGGAAYTGSTDGSVWNNSTTHHLYAYLNGTSYQLDQQVSGGTLFAQTTNGSAVVNTTTATGMLGTGTGSLTVAANTMAVGQTYVLHGYFNYGETGSPTLTFNPLIQSTGFSFSTTPGSSGTAGEITVYYTVTATGSSGSVAYNAIVNYGANSYANPVSGTLTINTTTSAAFNLQVTWSAASSSNTIQSIPSFTLRQQ